MNSSSIIRFATVRDLYAAFPTAAVDVGVRVCDEPSVAFVRELAKAGQSRAAISYCAYLLGRREAVGWACGCLRQAGLKEPIETECLAAAEAWVLRPEEARRLRAMELGARNPTALPTTWLARAVAWSGGNISTSDIYRLAPPPQGTAQAVRGALLIAPAQLPSERRETIVANWIDAGLRYAVGDPQRARNGSYLE